MVSDVSCPKCRAKHDVTLDGCSECGLSYLIGGSKFTNFLAGFSWFGVALFLALAFLYVLEYLGPVEWLPKWAHGPVIWFSFVAVMLAAGIYFEVFSNFFLKKQKSKKRPSSENQIDPSSED